MDDSNLDTVSARGEAPWLQRSRLLPSAAPSSNQKQDNGSIGRRYRPIPKCGLTHISKKWCVPYPTFASKNGASPIPSSDCRVGPSLGIISPKSRSARVVQSVQPNG